MTTFAPLFQSAATTNDFGAIPGAGPAGGDGHGTTNRGLCTLTYGGRILRFRTNPNEMYWDYELITKVENTYGGRVIQMLGTRLGDLSIKVDCGLGGWSYLMQVVGFLRDMVSDQRREVTPGTLEYTSRNWKLNVYAVNVPFQDEVTATTREIELRFKIQEDLTGVLSQITMRAEMLRLQEGVVGPGRSPHNQYNDFEQNGQPEIFNPVAPGGPGYSPTGIVNLVNSLPFGANPGGINPFGGIPFLPSIPGLSF